MLGSGSLVVIQCRSGAYVGFHWSEVSGTYFLAYNLRYVKSQTSYMTVDDTREEE
jgi:hypothetical protein